jgi:hypothetical protein
MLYILVYESKEFKVLGFSASAWFSVTYINILSNFSHKLYQGFIEPYQKFFL